MFETQACELSFVLHRFFTDAVAVAPGWRDICGAYQTLRRPWHLMASTDCYSSDQCAALRLSCWLVRTIIIHVKKRLTGPHCFAFACLLVVTV